MNAYLMLENYFIGIITYQLQGGTIYINILNDPNVNPGDPTHVNSTNYINDNFRPMIKAEVLQYLKTVNYLAVNIHDYRDPNTNMYAQDMAYQNYGIASDPVYVNILARSRFLCAQIMSSLGENDFGLYGAIVTPYNYTDGTGTTPNNTLTLNFSGPQNFSMTVTGQKIQSQFPYTQYSGENASPDNNWLFYDFSTMQDPGQTGNSYFDPNLPGGTYNITFKDNGTSSYPWPHLSGYNQLGSVNIQYFDPNNIDLNNTTTTPDTIHTLKFGYGSARWSWGFQRMSFSNVSQWTIPSSLTSNEITYVSGSAISGKNFANPFYTNFPAPTGAGNTLFPYSGSSSPVQNITIAVPSSISTSQSSAQMGYLIQIPIVIQQGANLTNGSSNSVQMFYFTNQDLTVNVAGGVVSYGPTLFFSTDTNAPVPTLLYNYNNNTIDTGGVLGLTLAWNYAGGFGPYNYTQKDPLPTQIYPKTCSYKSNTNTNVLYVSEFISCANKPKNVNFNLGVGWSAQIVYSGTYSSIFAQ
jgi:hypothetical protein